MLKKPWFVACVVLVVLVLIILFQGIVRETDYSFSEKFRVNPYERQVMEQIQKLLHLRGNHILHQIGWLTW